MRHNPASCIALVLSLLLALTSVTEGAARSAAPVAGWVVLCAGGEAAFVPVDRDGRPTRMHHCPDCTAAAVALPPADPTDVAAPMVWRCAPRAAASAMITHPAPMAFGARAPPHAV